MPVLVEEAVRFVAANIHEIIGLPIDMNCLNSSLVKKLAQHVSVEDLHTLKDKKDKLMSKLYMKKLELLFEDEQSTLNRCVYCNSLFTLEQRQWAVCPKAKIFIDFHGAVIAQHVPDRSWDINKFVMYLRQKQNLPWKEIFLKFYARLCDFQCADCNDRFLAAEINHCSFHTLTPKFTYGVNQGVYPCCNSQALRFSTTIKKQQGCTSKSHVLKSSTDDTRRKQFEMLMEHIGEIAEPYEYEKEDPVTGQVEVIKKLSDLVSSEKSLLKLVGVFLANKDRAGGDEVVDEDEDQAAGNESGVAKENEEGAGEGSEAEGDGVCDALNSELQQKQEQTAAFLTSKKNKKQLKYKEWRMDMLRVDDLT